MPNNNSKNEQSGRFAYDGLDRVIHERARLSVLTSLIAHPKGLVFGNLKAMCGLTDGNLSRHLQVLEEAKVIEIDKGYDRNRPQTICRITARGRQRYLDYLKVLEQVVRDAAQAAKAGSASHAPRPAAQHRTSRRRGGGTARRGGCARSRRDHAHAVCVFVRQLAASAAGGEHAYVAAAILSAHGIGAAH